MPDSATGCCTHDGVMASHMPCYGANSGTLDTTFRFGAVPSHEQLAPFRCLSSSPKSLIPQQPTAPGHQAPAMWSRWSPCALESPPAGDRLAEYDPVEPESITVERESSRDVRDMKHRAHGLELDSVDCSLAHGTSSGLCFAASSSSA